MPMFNVKVKITNADKLSHVMNVLADAPSANAAKGAAAYETQKKNPGMQVAAVDVYEVEGKNMVPKDKPTVSHAVGSSPIKTWAKGKK